MSMFTLVHWRQFWPAALRVLLPLAMVVWLAWLLAETVWLTWYGPGSPGVGDRLVLSSAAGQSESAVVLSEELVSSWQLFGAPQAAAVKQNIQHMPETRLSLELLGVFQHPSSAAAGAIIAEQGKGGTLFRIGDTVPGNATVEEIYPDQVILSRQGQREALRLKAAISGAAVPSKNNSKTSTRQAGAQRLTNTPKRGKNAAAKTNFVQQRAEVINQLGLKAAPSGGYVISDAAPLAQLEQVGLRSGDIIVSVNGKILGSRAQDVAVLEEFNQTQHASIVVERGAQRFTVNYPP